MPTPLPNEETGTDAFLRFFSDDSFDAFLWRQELRVLSKLEDMEDRIHLRKALQHCDSGGYDMEVK